VVHDQKTGEKFIPLNNIAKGTYEVADSNLSEYGVLGFEYGYSMVNPNNLVIWEGQFGDFANGAQIMIDQFITAAESKWLRLSGLVMLLPHGYEGQGPEHSSARLERFLQLCAEENIFVCYPTTPKSIFHLLRRQLKTNYRKPLIIMSPKSVLRNKYALSDLSEFQEGTEFEKVLSYINQETPATRVLICSGKIYYDLYDKMIENNVKNVAILRLEQLYPFPQEEVEVLLDKINAQEIFYVQEEPENMGAYRFVKQYLNTIEYIGRKAAASPAVGYLSKHNKEQESIVLKALGLNQN
jgi:2-oxoglutarate dehydrogenase E1 component